jgi:hypothetical protein
VCQIFATIATSVGVFAGTNVDDIVGRRSSPGRESEPGAPVARTALAVGGVTIANGATTSRSTPRCFAPSA